MQETYWSSAISELQETQKREYKEWVMNMHERDIADFSMVDNTDETGRSERSPSLESYVAATYDTLTPQEPVMEESFTIYLGFFTLLNFTFAHTCKDFLELIKTFSFTIMNIYTHIKQKVESVVLLIVFVFFFYQNLQGIK